MLPLTGKFIGENRGNMPASLPHPLRSSDLIFSAKIDYITLTNGGVKISLPKLSGRPIWTYLPSDKSHWRLTIHDPTPMDLSLVSAAYENPSVVVVEFALDMKPKPTLDAEADRKLLENSFLAVAARFRPEDKSPWDYGLRGALSEMEKKPQPLERRFAHLGEEVLYGHRRDWMQAKLYLKDQDDDKPLALKKQSVRMEITLKAAGCQHFNLLNLNDLFGYKYRKAFATTFRIIEKPEVRRTRGLSDIEFRKRESRMLRAWKKAGVGKFEVADNLPRADKLVKACKEVKARAKAQLPWKHYKLMRDQKANAKIGAALMNLERQMRSR